MQSMQGKTVPEGNGPVPQQDAFGSNQLTLADVYRMFEERLDSQLNRAKSRFDELTAFSKPKVRCSAATSSHGGRRYIRQEDSQAYGGLCCRTSNKWG